MGTRLKTELKTKHILTGSEETMGKVILGILIGLVLGVVRTITLGWRCRFGRPYKSFTGITVHIRELRHLRDGTQM